MGAGSSRETSLSIDLGGEQVLLERIEAAEALSQPFMINLDVISPLGEMDLLPHLGKSATVSVSQDGELQRYFHGFITEGGFERETPEGFHHRLVLRPWTHFLAHNRDFAIYQEIDALEIIKRVFDEAGISDVDYTRLSGTLSLRPYCVQYGESDFAFVSRLMEEEGLYYFFRHQADRHVMILCDAPASHVRGTPAALTYNPLTLSVFNTDSAARTEKSRRHYLQSWVERVATSAQAKVTFRDFDFEKPERPLEALAEGAAGHPRDSQEVYHYPGRYKDEGQGRRLGAVALDALRGQRRSYSGRSQASGLSCGATVSVAEHPVARLDGAYLITGTFHSITAERYRTGSGTDEAPYNVEIEAVPARTRWKAPQVTPRPRVHGLESAIVTGPAGEEIFTDEYGRVKVRFHWDRSGTPGEKSTCWMRVSQTGGLGNIILPRIGHEVLVDFLGGDPDRPVVVGRVFNRGQMPIYALPGNKTRALWRTKTYKQKTPLDGRAKKLDTGDPGANEIRFEDKSGHEEILIHSEKDLTTRVRDLESHHVGRDQEIMIGHDRQETVHNDEKVKIGGNQAEEVVKNRKVKIGADDSLEIKGKLKVKAGTTIEIEAGTSITLKVGSTVVKLDPTSIKLDSTMIRATGKATLEAKSPMTTVKGDGILTLKGGIVLIN
ncbi:MAG: type VI secretion system tip protein VgrG [Alphaproteobacteria bacterium]|nr:type VI secretion system tip protein VgrG [Alphaproteobacteria bacterium]